MDIVTHALLGALATSAIAPKNSARSIWASAGGVCALLPDVDVLIRSSQDPLLALEYHRHFTHSLFFAPLGAALGMLLLWPLFRRRIKIKTLYTACFVGYSSACLLDVCTSYGTHLLWPVFPQPFALSIISVVDPIFSLLIAMGLALSLWLRHGWLRWFGLVAGALYLCFGTLQLHRAQEAAFRWAENDRVKQGSAENSQILVKPTLGNLLLWRALIVRGGQVQALGLRVGPFGHVIDYAGERAPLIDLSIWHHQLGDSRAYRDLLRFNRFANGWLAVLPEPANRIGDVRYSMLPTSLTPLWGIQINEQLPDLAPVFFTQRDTRPEIRAVFLKMLSGESL